MSEPVPVPVCVEHDFVPVRADGVLCCRRCGSYGWHAIPCNCSAHQMMRGDVMSTSSDYVKMYADWVNRIKLEMMETLWGRKHVDVMATETASNPCEIKRNGITVTPADFDEAISLLKSLLPVAESDDCPSCYMPKQIGHIDCRLAAFLKKWGK